MRATTRDSTAPRKRRNLLRALSETPVLSRRSGRAAGASAHLTLGAVTRRDPVYAPATSLLARLGAAGTGGCAPPRRAVLVAARVDHPAHNGVDPLVGVRPLRPTRSALNLLHQVLAGLWSLGDVPVAEVPESGAQPKADGDSCGAEQRPPRSTAPMELQVAPPEEFVEVAEPPQAEAREPRTCERPCGPVGPGARSLEARAGRVHGLDPRCRGEHGFEDDYTPFARETPPEARGKPGHESPCPCTCVCGIVVVCVSCDAPRISFFDWVYSWLAPVVQSLVDVVTADSSVGTPVDQPGTVAMPSGGSSPALGALRGGQSQGLGMLSGFELDLGVMRPDLSLTALGTAGISGPAALAPPEQPGAQASLLLGVRGDETFPGQ